MEIIRCKNGHSYDPSVTPECPECARLRMSETLAVKGGTETWAPDAGFADQIGKTMPVFQIRPGEADNSVETEPVRGPGWGQAREAYQPSVFTGAYSSRVRTNEAGNRQDGMISPVVGWLVCIAGPSKGQDYKIHADNNYIGRASYMDISIASDDTISRENHAILAYDTREKLYYFAPGSGRGIVRLNGKAVLMMTELHAYDRIEIGKSVLIFMPLCGEKFSWDELDS